MVTNQKVFIFIVYKENRKFGIIFSKAKITFLSRIGVLVKNCLSVSNVNF